MTRAAGKKNRSGEMTSPDVEHGTAPNQKPLGVDSPEPGEMIDVAFFNAQDGMKGRDGGPYLDYEERYAAEVRRAALEGRDPEPYGSNVPAHVGTSLVTAPYVVDNSSTSNPSMAGKAGIEQALNDQAYQENSNLADPISVLQVQAAGEPATNEDNDEVDDDEENYTSTSSTDTSGY